MIIFAVLLLTVCTVLVLHERLHYYRLLARRAVKDELIYEFQHISEQEQRMKAHRASRSPAHNVKHGTATPDQTERAVIIRMRLLHGRRLPTVAITAAKTALREAAL